MSGTTWVARKLKDFKSKSQFWKETAIVEFTEQVVSAMKARGLKRIDLANMMGKSRAHVTQLLQGPNMTFGTAAELALSVGMRFRPVLDQVDPPIVSEERPAGEVSGDLLSQAMVETCTARGLLRAASHGPYEFVGASEGTSFFRLTDTRTQ